MTDTASPPGSRRWLMLPVVLLAMLIVSFDIWVVNVAAPSLQRDLHVSDAALQLIVGGYAFMYASGMVTGGRLGDLLGCPFTTRTRPPRTTQRHSAARSEPREAGGAAVRSQPGTLEAGVSHSITAGSRSVTGLASSTYRIRR